MRQLSVMLAVAVLGCGGSGKKAGNSSPENSGSDQTLREQMHENFVHLSAAKTAVIEGRLEDAQKMTTAVWPQRPRSIPEQWVPYIHTLEGGIELMSSASELGQAATAVSAIGRACGDCHEALGFDVFADGGDSGSQEDPQTIGGYMRMHQWAADRMWQGLVGPSPEVWKEAADRLVATELEELPEEFLVQPGMEQLLGRVHALAEQAASPALAAPGRQRLFAEFLGSCAGCHQSFLSAVD